MQNAQNKMELNHLDDTNIQSENVLWDDNFKDAKKHHLYIRWLKRVFKQIYPKLKKGIITVNFQRLNIK